MSTYSIIYMTNIILFVYRCLCLSGPATLIEFDNISYSSISTTKCVIYK